MANTERTAGLRIESEAAIAAVVAAVERSPAEPLRLAVLRAVRNGVITGEGPTTAGRIHFSRAIDAADTALVRRILMAGGAQPVTHAEADALFDIHEAACERADGGAFDDLLAKAIAHHVLAASGHRVPERARALSSAMALAGWTRNEALDPSVAAWLERRLRRGGRHQAQLGALAALLGPAAASRVPTLAIDLAA
ncbi:MAG: hypothetical protein ACJ8FP_07145 [Xanthobacteraceae bacterium]